MVLIEQAFEVILLDSVSIDHRPLRQFYQFEKFLEQGKGIVRIRLIDGGQEGFKRP